MGKKQLGGEESYLNNFVDEVMTSFNMKGGKFQKGGVVELSPMLVSLMTLGMRVAADPKLSAVLKKHNKLNGGTGELVSKAAISNLISGTGSFSGGNVDESDMFSTGVLPPTTGGRRGRKVAGGGEADDLMPSVSPDDEIADLGSFVEGGAKRKKAKKGKKSKKSKKGGGEEEMEEFSDFMSGGEADLEEMFSNMSDAMDAPVVGGKAKKGKKAKKAKKTKGGDGEADLEEMFSNMSDAMDAPVVGGKAKKAKKGKKTKGGEGEADLEEMFSNMSDAMDAPAVGGKAKKAKKGKRKTKGGEGDIEEMFSNMQETMDAPVVGAGKRRGKKGGAGLDNIFSFYK